MPKNTESKRTYRKKWQLGNMKNIFEKAKQNLKGLLLIAVSTTALSAKADVWVTQNQWSEAWEQKYQQWLQTSTGAKMFATKLKADGSANPYYGIRVDCADLVYSLRAIFSFENGLPYAITNTVSKAGPISNSVTRYDKLPAGHARLVAFLDWIYGIVSTRGLSADTFSPAINKVGTGTIILTTKKNHHSWTIRDVTITGNPFLIFNSTVGRLSGYEVQERQSWPNPSWIFEPEVDSKDPKKTVPVYKPGSYAGFRQWRSPEYLGKPEASVPGYSEEQHTVGLSNWKKLAQSHLAQTTETVDQIVLRLLKDACADFKQRVTAVAEAEQFKKSQPALSCMNATDFDEYSTPSRDRRLIDGLMQARVYFQDGLKKGGEQSFSPENLAVYRDFFPFVEKSAAEEAKLDKETKNSEGYCSLRINEKLGKLSLAELKRRMFLGQVSANPNDAATGRFGYAHTSQDIGYTTCKAQNFGLEPSVYDLNRIEQDARKEIAGH